MGQQFKYDEKGATFLYFLLSVFVMVLIPISYFFWPKGYKDEEKRLNMLCRIHGQSKWYKKQQKALQQKKYKPNFNKILIVLGWITFLVLVYKVSNVENDHVEYNPYEVLGIKETSTPQEIKKRYHALSKSTHPDKKGGNEEEFIRIAKAYKSLLDPETKENWKKYGNPDGPQAMQFGIALPKWIFESNNSFIVIGIYFLMFMILLPFVVGRWWYRTIRYSKEEVLLNTSQLFLYFLSKTTNMNLKRATMVFSAAFEFSHEHNSKMRSPTPKDNEELPELLRVLESNFNISENAKERPMNFPYSVKARILIYCHLTRMDTLSTQMTDDLDYVLTKSPLLIQEMINAVSQLTIMANYNKGQKPRLDTLENVMKMAPMMVQGLLQMKSPLLQLPYFNDDYVKYCYQSKKHSGVKNLRNLAALPDTDRRQMLRRMGDEAYDTMLMVLRNFPDIHLETRIHVIDDDETHIITAGAIVTVTLTMTRRSLGALHPSKNESSVAQAEIEAEVSGNDEQSEAGGEKTTTTQAASKSKPWEKQTKKKKKKKPAKLGKKQPPAAKKTQEKSKSDEVGDDEKKEEQQAMLNENNSDSEDAYSDEDSDPNNEKVVDEEEEEREWEAMQASFKKKEKAAFESIDKRTHTVYAPRYPLEKNEWWWVYIADRKNHSLLTAPVIICNLRDQQEVELKFPAPTKPGKYTYSIWCRSDSYLDCDRYKDIKLDVKDAKPVEEDHPQWQMSDEEDDDENMNSESEGISSEDESSQED